jgi:transposase-like protein
MRKKYNEKFKREIVRTFESLKPKPKQAAFAKQHHLNLNSFQNWLYVFRESKQQCGIIELRTKEEPKRELKITVHVSLKNGVCIDAVLDKDQFFDLLWQQL